VSVIRTGGLATAIALAVAGVRWEKEEARHNDQLSGPYGQIAGNESKTDIKEIDAK